MSTTHSFESTLGATIASYLAIKKALGRRFAKETTVLAQLDRFLVAHCLDAPSLTPDSFAAWSLNLAHLTPTVRRNRMRIVRNLCLYERRTDPTCFVPDPLAFPAPHVPRSPHIFTEEQIVRLLRIAASLHPTSTSPLHAEVLRLAVVLLYTAGLRRGELVRLVLSDYDDTERTLLVRTSKFHKSRLIALSDDAAHEIDLYLRARRRLPSDPSAPLLVSRSRGLRPYTGAGLAQGLRGLFRSADVRSAQGRLPRVHDLRHTYAIHALARWYRAGTDVQVKLPSLAIAMGHVSIASTAYYLAFLDPIAEAASVRFARHCHDVIDALPGGGGRP
jgi:integrase/recombinase XerD